MQGKGGKKGVIIQHSTPRIFVTLLWHVFIFFNVLGTFKDSRTYSRPQTQAPPFIFTCSPPKACITPWAPRPASQSLCPCAPGRPRLETTEPAHQENWILRPGGLVGPWQGRLSALPLVTPRGGRGRAGGRLSPVQLGRQAVGLSSTHPAPPTPRGALFDGLGPPPTSLSFTQALTL